MQQVQMMMMLGTYLPLLVMPLLLPLQVLAGYLWSLNARHALEDFPNKSLGWPDGGLEGINLHMRRLFRDQGHFTSHEGG